MKHFIRIMVEIFIAIIFLCSIFLIIVRLYNTHHENKNDMEIALQNRENQLKEYENEMEIINLNRKCKLFDANGKVFYLENIIKNKCLVYYFSPQSCGVCVERNLSSIKQQIEFFSKKNINLNVIVIANYDDIRIFKAIRNLYKITIPFYSTTDELGLRIEHDTKGVPFYFLTDINLRATLLHASRPELYEDNSYYELVYDYFAK